MNHQIHINTAATMSGDQQDHLHATSHWQSYNRHHPITAATARDVINGRGQGVQRHAGNVKYRKLVSVNKFLYAKCPGSDKIKISKSIVAAIRHFGGRFLKQDVETGIYFDIGDSGDKGAVAKTSQALREGQPEIRKQVYQAEGTNGATAAKPSTEVMPDEWYFDYSASILQSLHSEDEGESSGTKRTATARERAMHMAMDQFPSFSPAEEPDHSSSTQTKTNGESSCPASLGRPTHESTGRNPSSDRLTNISLDRMSSIKSILELLEPSKGKSIHNAKPYRDKEIFLENMSTLRKEERESSSRRSAMNRNSDDTEHTRYSKTSLMDVSIMTFGMSNCSLNCAHDACEEEAAI